MGRSCLAALSAWHRFAAVTTVFALLSAWAQPLEAAPKKKKKKPAPAPISAGELDAPTPASAPPAATPAPAPTPAPEPAPTPATPATDTAPEAGSAPATSHHHAADAEPSATLGAKHTFVLDDLSGFRASTTSGIGYAGPIGFSIQSKSLNLFSASGAVAGTETIHTTSIWVAPSADYFLFEHISIGAVIEFAWQSSSYDDNVFGTPTKSQSLPSTVSFTLIPRAGYLLTFGEHLALWPRLGMGFGVLQQNAITQTGASSLSTSTSPTYLLDVDAAVLYRLDSHFFLRAGPEFTWGPGAGLIDFSLAGGFGSFWSL
jgi:hypothetical protein